MNFELHPQLNRDCFFIGRLDLCQLLLMNDCQYPWFILVPESAGIREIYQLDPAQRALLQDESCRVAEYLADLFKADKMNIAAIGNVVPQLHIHHIVRFRTDKAWPSPVWGKYEAVPYSLERKVELITLVRQELGLSV
ncbi:MAG: HIT domain-containing protein [Methylomicrobium sp.]|nr:HIT domain-containing protein [Methylomicrobium sp.]